MIISIISYLRGVYNKFRPFSCFEKVLRPFDKLKHTFIIQIVREVSCIHSPNSFYPFFNSIMRAKNYSSCGSIQKSH